MPATLSTITGTFPDVQRTRAVSVWAAVAGGSAVLGVLVSGLLLEEWSWPSVFGLNVVLAAAAIAGAVRFVPESADPKAPRVDIGGAILAALGMVALGMVALVYSIIEAPTEGWASVRTLAPSEPPLVRNDRRRPVTRPMSSQCRSTRTGRPVARAICPALQEAVPGRVSSVSSLEL